MEGHKKIVAVNTRMTADHDAVRTNLTVDASGLTADEMFEYVIDSAVIKWQSSIRRKKDSTIPAMATYVVPKPGTRSVAEITPTAVVIKAFGAEKAAKLIEKYGSAEKVIDAMREFMDESESE
jgi:hypothetical protein